MKAVCTVVEGRRRAFVVEAASMSIEVEVASMSIEAEAEKTAGVVALGCLQAQQKWSAPRCRRDPGRQPQTLRKMC